MNPNVLCLTDTLTKLAFYGVMAYLIHACKVVVIAFINRRTELLDLFIPRTHEEVTIDNARRIGRELTPSHESEVILDEFPSEDEVRH